ncbi:MAG: N-acetylmuramic acid 6-phosphate etherase [Myxococcaceae bacterium]
MKTRRPPLTETLHPRAEDLELATPGELVRWLHAEDAAAVAAVRRELPRIAEVAGAAARSLRSGGRLVYVGAGTSGRLGALDAAELPPTFGTRPQQVVAVIAGGPAALTRSVEGAEDDALEGARALRRLKVGPADLVCGISASGTTPFVLGALAGAKRAGAATALVCCNPGRGAARAADWLVAPLTGPELVAGSTRLKAGTATKLVLNAISTAAMISLGKVYRGRMVDLAPSNRKLAARAVRMVAELTGLGLRQAASLLQSAGGSPRVAIAMHLTGVGRRDAERRLLTSGLRALERPRRKRAKDRA